MPDETDPPPPPKEKRKPAKKIRGSLGPFKTVCTTFDRGTREIEISKITEFGITYRLKGQSKEHTIPHENAYLKAVSLDAGVDTSARTGRIKRNG